MVDRIRYPTVSYLPFYYAFFKFLLLTIFNLQANILTTKDILSNLGSCKANPRRQSPSTPDLATLYHNTQVQACTAVTFSPEVEWDNFGGWGVEGRGRE